MLVDSDYIYFFIHCVFNGLLGNSVLLSAICFEYNFSTRITTVLKIASF